MAISRSKSFYVGLPLCNFRELTKNLVILKSVNCQCETVSPPASGPVSYLGAIYVLIDKYTLCLDKKKSISCNDASKEQLFGKINQCQYSSRANPNTSICGKH